MNDYKQIFYGEPTESHAILDLFLGCGDDSLACLDTSARPSILVSIDNVALGFFYFRIGSADEFNQNCYGNFSVLFTPTSATTGLFDPIACCDDPQSKPKVNLFLAIFLPILFVVAIVIGAIIGLRYFKPHLFARKPAHASRFHDEL